MELDRLLGNSRLKESLRAAFRADRLSHSYLICGPEGSGRHTLAVILAQAMQCTSGEARPCGKCLQCRKIRENVHPDFITVDDPERKTVGVELIRRTREDVYIKPNEGRRKIYLIPRAMDMNPSAQNALLKVMEEPPAYAAFLLITDVEQKLLPTIRSRCVSLRLSPLEEQTCVNALAEAFPGKERPVLRAAAVRAGGILGQARKLLEQEQPLLPQTLDFVRCFAARDKLGLTLLLTPLEKLKREQLLPILAQWAELLEQAMAVREGMPPLHKAAAVLGRSRRAGAMLQAFRALRRAMELLQGNVGVGAVCGALQVWLDLPD